MPPRSLLTTALATRLRTRSHFPLYLELLNPPISTQIVGDRSVLARASPADLAPLTFAHATPHAAQVIPLHDA